MRHAVAVFALLVLAAGSLAQAPVIKASEPGWDFGVREQGESDSKTIAIRNEGDADLVITGVKVTCGCVRHEMKETTIKPGKSADLVLKLFTAGQIGKVRKFAYILSNDPKTPNLILNVNGEVRGRWDISTVNVVFGADGGRSQEATTQITVREGERVRLKRVWTKSSHVAIETFERYESGTTEKPRGRFLGYDVKVKLLPNCPPGNISAVLRVETTDNQIPFRNITVHARTRGDVKVTPNRLFVGRIFHGKKKSTPIKVTRKNGEPFKVKAASSDLDYVKVHVLPLNEGKEYDVLVTVAPPQATREIVGHVRIETDIPGFEVMTVDLEGRAAAPR